MSDTEKKKFVGRIRIMPDDLALNPREDCDPLSKMICFHGCYTLGDKDHGFTPNSFDGWGELADYIEKELAAKVMGKPIIKPLYLYDHGGITISSGAFSCPWDSGQVGFMYMPKYMHREAPKDRSRGEKLSEWAYGIMDAELEVYDAYLRGDVYHFLVEKPELPTSINDDGWEYVDSCGGFYGYDYKTNGMLDHIQCYLDEGYELVED